MLRPISAVCGRGRRASWIRTTAWACFVLMLIASGRGLLPSICANLTVTPAAEPVYGADSVMGAIGACCAELRLGKACSLPGGGQPAQPKPGALKDCAFCKLTSAHVEPLVFVALQAPALVQEAAPTAGPAALHTQWPGFTTSVRGPPAPLSA